MSRYGYRHSRLGGRTPRPPAEPPREPLNYSIEQIKAMGWDDIKDHDELMGKLTAFVARQYGVSPEAAAGHVGNLEAESGLKHKNQVVRKPNPNAPPPPESERPDRSNNGYDWGQYTGPRKWDQLQFARLNNLKVPSNTASVAFIIHDYNGQYAHVMHALGRVGDSNTATAIVLRSYEAPKEKNNPAVLAVRQKCAREALTAYHEHGKNWAMLAPGAVQVASIDPSSISDLPTGLSKPAAAMPADAKAGEEVVTPEQPLPAAAAASRKPLSLSPVQLEKAADMQKLQAVLGYGDRVTARELLKKLGSQGARRYEASLGDAQPEVMRSHRAGQVDMALITAADAQGPLADDDAAKLAQQASPNKVAEAKKPRSSHGHGRRYTAATPAPSPWSF